MSSLTEQERVGLDEVFLAISSKRNKEKKLLSLTQRFHKYFMQESMRHTLVKPIKMLNHVHKRIKSSNFLHQLPKNGKKKKNLSK
ncbi:MAG: hypothetical protein U9Q62_06460 [Campylobacterota bacterium]|nr:hypothetical protein [Campylobacterota bacterium]